MDQCTRCECRGDLAKCESVDCTYHELWYVQELKNILRCLPVGHLSPSNCSQCSAQPQDKGCARQQSASPCNTGSPKCCRACGKLFCCKDASDLRQDFTCYLTAAPLRASTLDDDSLVRAQFHSDDEARPDQWGRTLPKSPRGERQVSEVDYSNPKAQAGVDC